MVYCIESLWEIKEVSQCIVFFINRARNFIRELYQSHTLWILISKAIFFVCVNHCTGWDIKSICCTWYGNVFYDSKGQCMSCLYSETTILYSSLSFIIAVLCGMSCSLRLCYNRNLWYHCIPPAIEHKDTVLRFCRAKNIFCMTLLMRQHSIYVINTLRPRQNGRHFADDIFIWCISNIKCEWNYLYIPKLQQCNRHFIPHFTGHVISYHKNTERNTTHTIVSWPTHVGMKVNPC